MKNTKGKICIKEIEEKHIIDKFVDKLGSFWD
jgi:hypothetical protein